MKDRWYGHGNIFCGLSRDLADYSGDWRDSLTLPESWTKEPPFRDGEIVISIPDGINIIKQWQTYFNPNCWRRPTEAEWKVLKRGGITHA